MRYKRPTKLAAPDYVDALMNWAQNILDDEAIFPNTIGTTLPALEHPFASDEDVGAPFPRTFKDTVRTIVRRLFRVYAHIYSNHFDQICALGIEGVSRHFRLVSLLMNRKPAHLNTSYRHFFLFIHEVCPSNPLRRR